MEILKRKENIYLSLKKYDKGEHMKVLVIFFDMFKGKLANENSNDKFNKFLKNIGGTIYKKAYTPACETYRSMECFQTGKDIHQILLKERGLEIPESKVNIKNILKEQNYRTSVIGDVFNLKTGVYNGISDSLQEINYQNNPIKEIEEYLKKEYSQKKILNFIGLELAHEIRDNFGGEIADNIILEKSGKFLQECFKDISLDNYDYVFIFSDHGYKKSLNNSIDMIDDDRSNILLFMRKKYEKKLRIDNKLRGIFDIYATLNEILKLNIKDIKGKSLLSTSGHDYIVIEDYKNWKKNKVGYITSHDVWGIREEKSFYMTDLENEAYFIEDNEKGYKIEKINIKQREIYFNILEKETIGFNSKRNSFEMERIIEKIEKNNRYIDGEKKSNKYLNTFKYIKEKGIIYTVKRGINYFVKVIFNEKIFKI